MIRPPSLVIGNEEIASHQDTQSRRSGKSLGKNKKKETSLSLKKKKTPTTMEHSQEHKEPDTGSIHSYGSKGSIKKGKKKQASLGMVKHYQPSRHINNSFHSSNEQERQDEEIQVMEYRPEEKSDTKAYYEPQSQLKELKKISQQQKVSKKVSSPFLELDDDVPMVQIDEKARTFEAQEYISPKAGGLMDPHKKIQSIFQKSKDAENPSPSRKKIFKNTSLHNQSSVAISSQISTLQNQSKTMFGQSRKSKSKLGNLLRKSRQKQETESKASFNQSENYSVGELREESRVNCYRSKLVGGSKQKMVFIEQKPTPHDDGDDMIQLSHSDLKLSQSQSHQRKLLVNQQKSNQFQEKDSLCFNLQGEKKRKGLSVTSKDKSPQNQMLRIPHDNLVSKQLQQKKPSQPINIEENDSIELIKITKQNLESKRVESREKLKDNLKKNEAYLLNSGIFEESNSKKDKNIPLAQVKTHVENVQPEKQEAQIQQKKVVPSQHPVTLKFSKEESQQQEITQKQIVQQHQKVPASRQINESIKVERRKKQNKIREQVIFEEDPPQTKPEKKEPHHNLDNIPESFSTFSKEKSSNGSQKSKKKAKSKREGVIPLKKEKPAFLGGGSPRAEESFYQQSESEKPSAKPPVFQEKKLPQKLISFSDEENEAVNDVKSKTDTVFYAPSVKAPSSKPPLSRKSNSSKAKSKEKVNVIEKKTAKVSQIKSNPKIREPVEKKKLTLIELAMQKEYEDDVGSNSQCSFDSHESFNHSRDKSVKSRGSIGSYSSKKSQKKQGIIKKKDNTISNINRPPVHKIHKENMSNKAINHEEEMRKQEHQQAMRKIQLEKRVIVSKDTYFIDEKGRLVHKDLIIQGNKVYGKPTKQFDESVAYNRLRKSRQKRKSRSREKSMQRSKYNRSQRRQSQGSGDQSSSSYQNFYSRNYVESQISNQKSVYPPSSSQDNYKSYQPKAQSAGNSLRQFMKPIEQSSPSRQQNEPQQYDSYYESEERYQNFSYNEMFAPKTSKKKQDLSREKRTMKRTEKVKRRN